MHIHYSNVLAVRKKTPLLDAGSGPGKTFETHDDERKKKTGIQTKLFTKHHTVKVIKEANSQHGRQY